MGIENTCCSKNDAIAQNINRQTQLTEFVSTGSSESFQQNENVQSTLILPPLKLNLISNLSQASAPQEVIQPQQIGFIPPINFVQQPFSEDQPYLSDRLSDISKIDYCNEINNRNSVIQESKLDSNNEVVSDTYQTVETVEEPMRVRGARPSDSGIFAKPFLFIKEGRPQTPE
ncbi:hypothetical protein SS50377_21060 [Spironucleus salmonicida]|uniref:Uncharacterized protein n=1 Tax=Spironucleus salmonicida TaxID=348837 RepID=V6LGT3_9EUKA|nr:hypothetical protein SS50377_21060 [Spironucleus salmonicida]|eukprot:EST43717.1 Hypothetical protein SS50377_16771 [Spironucleus salmonicida]